MHGHVGKHNRPSSRITAIVYGCDGALDQDRKRGRVPPSIRTSSTWSHAHVASRVWEWVEASRVPKVAGTVATRHHELILPRRPRVHSSPLWKRKALATKRLQDRRFGMQRVNTRWGLSMIASS